jgi:hypothetical protein
LRQGWRDVETFGHEGNCGKSARLRRWVLRPEIGVPKYSRKKCSQKPICGRAVLKY